ncbi:MAG: hypothetical protein HY537_16795 [Deltaproteobacteria bacterium]|nr:hypothetical protein [Deltaproteobacteria bacterium]
MKAVADQFEHQKLCSLLHSETCAEQAYASVVSRENGTEGSPLMSKILADHKLALAKLSELLPEGVQLTERSDDDDCSYLAVVVEISGNPTTDPMALKALKELEERCQLDYELVLASDDFRAEMKRVIRFELLPLIKTHLDDLAYMLALS